MQYVFELTVKKILEKYNAGIQPDVFVYSESAIKKRRSKHLTQRPFGTKRNYFPQMCLTCSLIQHLFTM